MEALAVKGTLKALADLVSLSLSGSGGASIQVHNTYVGTVLFEGSVDGINFLSILGTPSDSDTGATSTTSTGLWFFRTVGLQTIRARCSAYTSGQALVDIRAVVSSPGGGSSGGGGGGNVNAGGTLANNALLIGQGGTDVASTTTGTGILTALGINTGSAGAPVLFNGALGTPTSGTMTNLSGTPSAINLSNATSLVATALPTATRTRSIGFVFSGATLAPAAYIDAYIPYACTITAATVMGDVVGAVVFGVAASNSFATAPSSSIVASAPPTLSGDDGSQDTTLTGWTTAVAAGTRMRTTVTSTSGLAWASLTLTVTV